MFSLNVNTGEFESRLESSFKDYADRLTKLKEDIVSEVRDVNTQNVLQARSVDGSPLAPLTQRTIDYKRRKGYPDPSRILFATGTLSRSILSKNNNNETGEVTIADIRNKIGSYLMKKRDFFGTGKNTDTQIEKRLKGFNING